MISSASMRLFDLRVALSGLIGIASPHAWCGEPVCFSPEILATVQTDQAAYDTGLLGSALFVANNNCGIKVYDIGVLDQPELVGIFTTDQQASDLAVGDDFILIGDGQGGIVVASLSNLSNPVQIGAIAQIRPIDIEIDGALAVVIGHSPAEARSALWTVDVSTPAFPTLLGSLTLDNGGRNLRLDNGVAFIANNEAGLSIIDVRDPLQPAWLASVETDGDANDLAVRGDLVYVCTDGDDGQPGRRVEILNVRDPSDPVLVGAVQFDPALLRTPTALDIEDDLLLVGTNTSDMLFYHLRDDPTTPRFIGSTRFAPGGQYVEAIRVRDGVAYVSARLGGTHIVSVGGAVCLPDLDRNCTLDFFDFVAFLAAYGNQDPVVDFTGDGSFNFFDVVVFIEKFRSGCS